MNTFERSGKHLAIKSWQKINSNLIAGFTTREGGNSTMPFHSMNMGFHVNDNPDMVRKNRKLFADEIGFSVENWVGSKQVHAKNIVKITKEDRGLGALDFETAIPDADGLYTSDENILLTSLYADCVPLYFYSPNDNLIGLAHAGWKGTVAKIGPSMITMWQDKENVDVKSVLAAIGPSIGQCCYEVDDVVINEVNIALGVDNVDKVYKKNEAGNYQLNLKKLNEVLLLRAGVLPENMSVSDQCTSCQNDVFFSHRSDRGKTGRMMSYIGRKGD
ncbi:peptidoglycan editing factor PgeF [Fictibacillus nanhaiensis]|uniref:Purine nucleoside phosphorylase n=1 Tax=Fictibacillus nanhaiensis TaxID=742169 RepID=A0ABS2ZV40_9BACL|nr:peptidoglycan editing factor PgeF [Fictibacillus nanhaiensis]